MAQSATPYQRAQSPATPTLHFCPLEAESLGLNEAIVVARLRFWLSRTKHHFGGRPWVYNTYSQWQRQFPFWSVFTVKAIFRRLEQLGVLESTQRFNTNRWLRTKWYTLNLETLAELVGSAVAPNASELVMAEAAAGEAAAMEAAPPIEGIDQPPIEGIDFVPCLKSGRASKKILKRAREGEPSGGARQPAPPDPKPAEEAINELDAAYEAIPEAERETWLERADRALAAAGMPEWMRIVPTVKEMALRLWVGSTIPEVATG